MSDDDIPGEPPIVRTTVPKTKDDDYFVLVAKQSTIQAALSRYATKPAAGIDYDEGFAPENALAIRSHGESQVLAREGFPTPERGFSRRVSRLAITSGEVGEVSTTKASGKATAVTAWDSQYEG